MKLSVPLSGSHQEYSYVNGDLTINAGKEYANAKIIVTNYNDGTLSSATSNANVIYEAKLNAVVEDGTIVEILSVRDALYSVFAKNIRNNMDAYTNGKIDKEILNKAIDVISAGGVYITENGEVTPEGAMLMEYDSNSGTITIKQDVLNLGIAFSADNVYVNGVLSTGRENGQYYDTIKIEDNTAVLSQSNDFPHDKFNVAESVTTNLNTINFVLMDEE